MRSRIHQRTTRVQHSLSAFMSIGVALIGSLAACSSGEAGSTSGEDAHSGSPLAADSQEYQYDDFGPGTVEGVFAGRAFELVGQDNTGMDMSQGMINSVQCIRNGRELSFAANYYPNGKVMVQPGGFSVEAKFALGQEPVVEKLMFSFADDATYWYPGDGAPVGLFNVTYDSDANAVRVTGDGPFSIVPATSDGSDVGEPAAQEFDLLVSHICLQP